MCRRYRTTEVCKACWLLAIALGLMATPRILVLDEPSLGLAPAMINELFDVLATLRDDGVIILLVYQMAALALFVAANAYCLLKMFR